MQDQAVTDYLQKSVRFAPDDIDFGETSQFVLQPALPHFDLRTFFLLDGLVALSLRALRLREPNRAETIHPILLVTRQIEPAVLAHIH